MDNRQRALNYLGLARRGNNLVYGEETVGAACRAGHGRLLLLASDAADNTFRRARTFTQSGKPPMIRVPFTKDELGAAIGCNACAICLLTDVALAKAFVEALDEPAHYAQLLADLEVRVDRVKKRRMEEKAHEKNLRHGGKKRKTN